MTQRTFSTSKFQQVLLDVEKTPKKHRKALKNRRRKMWGTLTFMKLCIYHTLFNETRIIKASVEIKVSPKHVAISAIY